MKKTYNINISGYSFVIDEDAYEILDSYLSTLGKVCARDEQPETAADIEGRIAEIFSENLAATRRVIITLQDVRQVIDRMGRPEEILGVEIKEEDHPGQPSSPPPFPARGTGFLAKRLYRDIDNKVLGGVCSGLAWYLGIDVVWVRIIMVALAFLSGLILVVIYIILWIAIPPARTPYERMRMMGITPTVENVGRVVKGDCKDGTFPTGNYPQGNASDGFATAGKVVVMVLTVIGLLISGALLVAVGVAFMGCLIAVCVANGSPHSSLVEAKLIMGCVMGGSVVLGIPLFLLFRRLIEVLTERTFTALSPVYRVFLAAAWLLGVAACITCGVLLG